MTNTNALMGNLMVGEPVVLGVDGSEYGLNAAAVAATEASRHGRPLVIMHATESTIEAGSADHETGGHAERDLADLADRDVRAATDRVRAIAPDVEIRPYVASGSPAGSLVDMSDGVSLIVLGAHGRSALTDLIAGSVAVQVPTHARCPVLIVRGRTDLTSDVVLGTDGSPASDAATTYAFAEAELRGVGVTAVHAWRHPVSTGVGDEMFPAAITENQTAETAVLEKALARCRETYPNVKVTERVVRGGAAKSLVEASSGGQLVVVGARGHGGFTGLLLGSVGQALIHRADCPVVIVRPTT